MGASLTASGAYVMPSGALVLPGLDTEGRRGVHRWLRTAGGAAWLAEAVEEQEARRAGALAALTRECPLPSPTALQVNYDCLGAVLQRIERHELESEPKHTAALKAELARLGALL